ncbi:MAG: carbohydrate ABC transporter permease [FCB group bacterium]|nr:carbohydrate ABC transporter permease [FCB group bacterium]
MVSATFKPEIEIQSPNLIPSAFSVDSYRAVFNKIPIGRAFINSVFVSVCVTFSVLVLSSIVGYALSHLKFRGRELIFSIMLFTMMIPFQVTLIPMYVLMVKFGWVNTYMALIFPALISVFGIYLFKQYFQSIPHDLIEAARLDGYHELFIIFRIVWPNSVPAIVTVGILTFMNIWNDVLWPIIVIRTRNLMTMPQMVTLFATGGQAEAQIGTILASATMLALPVVIMYLFFQRHFIESMATTGLKE